MPNDVYRTTREGLAALISPRAATRLLDRVLQRVDLDAETVDAKAMQRLLRGKLRRELEPILPPRGLRRQLKRLDRAVAETAAAHDPPPPDPAPASQGGSPGPVATPPPAPASATATLPAPPPAAAEDEPPLLAPASEPRHAWQRLVEVEGVHRALWACGDRLVEDRGEGPAADRALEQVLALTRLTGRRSAVRSWHVRHGEGHVLLGTAGDRLLLVQGSADLNLGAVYAAFAALEEES